MSTSNGYANGTTAGKNGHRPTHPELFQVSWQPGASYNSSLVSLKAFTRGQNICPIEGTTPGSKAYSSVQVSHDKHIELNSDLLYCNHSCSPSVAFVVDGDAKNWHVRALRDIEPGQTLTFFYPSTEFDMEQPFDCTCGSEACLGRITGAAHLSPTVLSQYELADHLIQLKAAQLRQEGKEKEAEGFVRSCAAKKGLKN